MATAKVQNPRKQFQFSFLIPGLPPFLAQEITSPDVEIEQVIHGDVNFEVKTGGMKKVGNLRVSKISPSNELDRGIDDWMGRIQNTLLGGGQLPMQYKVTGFIDEYNNDGITVAARYQMDGMWPQKKNGVTYSRRGSDNVTTELEFSVDDFNRIS